MCNFKTGANIALFFGLRKNFSSSSSHSHLLQQVFLPFAQIGGELHVVRQDKVAARTVGIHVAFPFQADFGARLCPRLDFQFQLVAVRGLHNDGASQQCRVHVDADSAFSVGIAYSTSFVAERVEAALETRAVAARASASTSAEHLGEEIRETASAELAEVEAFEASVSAASARGASAHVHVLPMLAVLVILGPLFGVVQHVVGFVQGLELGFGFRVVGVQVGMELLGPFLVGGLDVLLRGILADAHYFVVINKRHGKNLLSAGFATNKMPICLKKTPLLLFLHERFNLETNMAGKAADKRIVSLKIVHTSDVHGSFFMHDYVNNHPVKGSLSRVYAYVQSLRRIYGERLLLLDGGDILQGTPVVYCSNFVVPTGKNLAAEIMNYMAYDTGVMGNHDLETGHEVYDRWTKSCRFPILGANIGAERYVDFDNELPSRAVFNIGFDYDYRKISASASVYNLLNADYYQGGASTTYMPWPQQSINFLIRLSYKF